MKVFIFAGLASLSLASLTLASGAIAAETTAEIYDRDGASHGSVQLADTASGATLVMINLTGLPPGTLAVHLHETGDCAAPDFESAGGHITADRQHGVRAEGGSHPGDLPNLNIAEDGLAVAEVFLPDTDIARDLMDEDGAAFVVHSAADDYESQPSGNAGDRIACGVFEPSAQ